jgi:hypothetical protein
MSAEVLVVAACCFVICGGWKYAAASLFIHSWHDHAANNYILTNHNVTALLSKEEKRDNMENTSTPRKRLRWHGLMFLIFYVNNRDSFFWYAACPFSHLICCFSLHVIFSQTDTLPFVRWGCFLPFVPPALSGCCLFVLGCCIFAWSSMSWWFLYINFSMLLYEVVTVTLCWCRRLFLDTLTTIWLLLQLLQQHVLIGTPAHENTSYMAG